MLQVDLPIVPALILVAVLIVIMLAIPFIPFDLGNKKHRDGIENGTNTDETA
jgi:hypothetical protein